MSYKIQKTRYLHAACLLMIPLFIFASACEQPSAPATADEISSDATLIFDGGADKATTLGAQLAAVRKATVHFQDYNNAVLAGYAAPDLVKECVELPGVGGMGYHFVNWNSFVLPEELDITQPQAILYEPQKNGRLRLIAVEYIVPGLILDENGPAPELFGQEFHWNPFLNLWALHVWVWQNNPLGMFEDWNPKVNCDYAPES